MDDDLGICSEDLEDDMDTGVMSMIWVDRGCGCLVGTPDLIQGVV